MEKRNEENKLLIKLGVNVLFIFITGYILFFSLPIYSFYNPQKVIVTLIQPIVRWIGIHFFGLDSNFTGLIISDSQGLLIFLFLLLVISFFIGLLWLKFIPYHIEKVKYWMKIIISYYLSFVLFIYGANKIFKCQFYEPEPNILFTPLGYLSKDILYWSALGSSYSYNIIIGLVQIITAFFLFFKKSRIIAATAAVVLFVNIVIINFTYDISVKVFSSFLLFISIIIAFPLFKFIYLFFYKEQRSLPTYKEWSPQRKSKKSILIYVILKTLVIGGILFETFFIYFKENAFNGDKVPKYSLFGAYQVFSSKTSIKRFFFHSGGYFIIQENNENMKDYKIMTVYSEAIKLKDYNDQIYYLNYRMVNDTIYLQGMINSTPIFVNGKKIDLKKLPLLQNQFHLTIDNIKE